MEGTQTQKDTQVNDLLRRISRGNESTIDVVKEMIPEADFHEGVRARLVVTEKVTPPERMESMARAHVIYDAVSLAEYVGRYGTENTVVFINVTERIIRVALDETATHGVEQISCRPQYDPRFLPWVALSMQGGMDIQKFADFLRRHRRIIDQPDGRELAMILSQVKTSTKVVMDRGRGRHAINGLVVETTIQGQKASEAVEIPETIVLYTPVFVMTCLEQPYRYIEVDINVYSDGVGEAPRIMADIAIPELAEAEVNEFMAMEEYLRKELSSDITIVGGEAHRKEWPVIT